MASLGDEESQVDMTQTQPLLPPSEITEGNNSNDANNGGGGGSTKKPSKVVMLETAVKECVKGALLLAKHVPAISALVFEIFVRITTARGNCTRTTRIETIILIFLCAISSVFFMLTDSFKDDQNKTRYGFVTLRGLLVLEGAQPPPADQRYKINCNDFLHVFATLVVFFAVVLYNNDVVKCFFGKISDVEYVVQLFTALPIVLGFLGCLLFLLSPSKRHGLGFPFTSLTSQLQ